jgi:hypothetical protein
MAYTAQAARRYAMLDHGRFSSAGTHQEWSHGHLQGRCGVWDILSKASIHRQQWVGQTTTACAWQAGQSFLKRLQPEEVEPVPPTQTATVPWGVEGEAANHFPHDFFAKQPYTVPRVRNA